MNGVTQLIASGFLYGIGVTLVGLYIRTIKKDVKEMLGSQFVSCSKEFKHIQDDTAEQCEVLNSHGHKGLDQNGSKVVRY